MALNTTPQFESTYTNFLSYPEQLRDRHSYAPTLQAYKERLESAAATLLNENEKGADVPFRDLDKDGTPAKMNVFSDERLRVLLGDTATDDPLTNTRVSGSHTTKRDPACRFIFLWGTNSRSKLKLTRRMLLRILSYHQVMPRYLEFLFLFGQRSIPTDITYSGFREQTSLDTPLAGQVLPDLGRSGRHYQMCYNLKSPAHTPSGDQEWSIRQAAIYHRFDVEYGTTLWIITKGDLQLKDAVQDITGADGRAEDKSFSTVQEAFRASLSIHVHSAHWATNEWRWYVQWLEDTVNEKTRDAVQGSRFGKDVRKFRKEYTSLDLQQVQIWEEKVHLAVTSLEANASVLTALRDYYLSLAENSKCSLKDTNVDDIRMFTAQVKDLIGDCNMQSMRTKLLVQIASQRKTMILQHLQSQATETMETLATMSQKEAIAMRIITIVTLVYLPATFVSTFFSTDVVSYQNQDGTSNSSGGQTSYSSIAMQRWFEVTVPLTVITFLLSWIAYRKAKKNIGLRVWARGAMNDDVPLLPQYWEDKKG